MTGLGPDSLDGPGHLDEFELARKVAAILAPPPGVNRILLTFNGIRFDDEIIRRTLFRNLLDPFVTSTRNNTRVDAFHLLHLAMRASPGLIPETFDGQGVPVRKLDRVAPALGIEIDAHDAVGDARATLTLAKYIREGVPWAWDMCLARGVTGKLENRLEDAWRRGALVWHFRRAHMHDDIAPCVILGHRRHKQWLLADLRHDPSGLPDDLGDITEATKGDRPFLRVAKASQAAMVLFEGEEEPLRPAQSPAVMRQRAGTLLARSEAVGAYLAAFRRQQDGYPVPGPDRTGEERLYAKIESIGHRDREARGEFHALVDWRERAKVRFDDDCLAEFAGRLVLRHCGHELDRAERERLEAACAKTLARPHAEPNGRWFTLEDGLKDEDCTDAWREWAAEAYGVASSAPGP